MRVSKARLGVGVAGIGMGLGSAVAVEVRLGAGVGEGVGGIEVGSRAIMVGLSVAEETSVGVFRSPTTLSVVTR